MNKINEILVATIGLALLLSSPAVHAEETFFPANEESLTVEALYFTPTLSLKVNSNKINYNNGTVDFKNDLGLSDKSAPEYRIQLSNNLRIAYMKLNYNGNSTLHQTLNYQDVQYNANAVVNSKLDITYVRLTRAHHITWSDTMSIDWLLDFKGFKFDTAISGQDASGKMNSAAKTFQGVVPTIGASIIANLDDEGTIKINAEISGLPLGKYGYFYDGEVGLKYKPTEHFSAIAGYRALDLNVKNPSDNENGQFKFSGPYFGITGNF